MMLTTKGRYAVMAMVDLAYYGDNSNTIALHEIANRQHITVSYLEQLFNKLKKHNLVSSVKGPGGGYTLSRKADTISVLEIINAVEESIKITRCSLGNNNCFNKKGAPCFTHALWEGLGKEISNYLGQKNLNQICESIKNGTHLLRS